MSSEDKRRDSEQTVAAANGSLHRHGSAIGVALTAMEINVSSCLTRLIARFPRRPGKGWKEYPLTPVWEHASGVRVHIHGLCRLTDGTIIDGNLPTEEGELKQAILEQGGTRRRGLMVWALALSPNDGTELRADRSQPKGK